MSTIPLNRNSAVGDWVSEHPRTSRIFEQLQIDYCCGGRKPLEQACLEKQLDPDQVEAQLNQSLGLFVDAPTDHWLTASLTGLCDHIESTHHDYLRAELPRLAGLIDKVVAAHGSANPHLAQVREVFSELRNEMEPHMFKEEKILFPAIRSLERGGNRNSFPFGSVANPIRRMELEHDLSGDALSRLRQLTQQYAVPEGACNTYRAMLDGLRELEADMHQHVHKENNILFPRAIELEQSV